MPHFFSENRLLNLTLDDINAQRLKQGATPVVAPMTTRASTAQGNISNVKAQENFQNNQFTAANQRYADTQAYFDANKDVRDQVNAQIKAQNNPLAGMTEEQMRQATGTFGTPINGVNQFVTGQTQAKDVLSQAGEGASLAKLRASLNLAGLPDITQDQQFLADWNNTMKTKALGGTPEAIRQEDGTMKVTAPYSTDSNFRELAAQRLRKAIKENSKVGYTESDIEKFLSSTAYTDPIKETASNTGLGGTFDDKGKFVPRTVAEAQNVLATSRSATERAQAQKVIDDELGKIKGYVPRTVTDQYGATYTTFSESAEKTAMDREEAKNRMAVEEQNRINLQKLKDDAKKKVSLMIPKDIQDTDEKLQQLKAVLDSLSPELRASAQYEIQTMINGQRRLSKATEDALNTFMTDEEIDKSYDATEARIKQVEQLFLELADDSRKTAERVANYNRDMLMIDKKIIEQRAAEEETKQMQANIKNERKLRRQLGALGITTDLQGLQFLDDAIQEGQSTLSSLRNANSLTLLKAQLAIGEGYAIEMQKAIDSQKSSYLDITTKTTDALIAVKKSISLDKKEKNKGIRDILTKDAEEKNKLETDTAKALRELTKETLSSVDKQLDNQYKRESLGWQIWNNAYDNYKGNVPKAILEQIKQYIPNFDVAGAMKKGGGTGIGGFSISQRDGVGNPISFDQFISQKMGGGFGPVKKDQMALWRKEYDAKLAYEESNSPSGLIKEMQIKLAQSGNFTSVDQRNDFERMTKESIKRGDTKYARQILDNVGARPPEKTIAQVSSAERVLNDLDRAEVLLNSIEDNIGAFPTKGRLWQFINENIETSPEYAEVKQLVDSNLAPYSRGISGERGATTEPDVQRAISSLIDINNDSVAVRASLARAKKQAKESIDIYLQGMRDGGYRVKALQETSKEYGAQQVSPSTTNWLYSQ